MSAVWICTHSGQPTTFYEETFRRGAVIATLIDVDQSGAGSLAQVVGWAQIIDASLTGAQQ